MFQLALYVFQVMLPYQVHYVFQVMLQYQVSYAFQVTLLYQVLFIMVALRPAARIKARMDWLRL